MDECPQGESWLCSSSFGLRLHRLQDALWRAPCVHLRRPVNCRSGRALHRTRNPLQGSSWIGVLGFSARGYLVADQSIAYYIALQDAGVPVEMHLYAEGGHGFGLRHTGLPIAQWPRLVDGWLETIGMVRK